MRERLRAQIEQRLHKDIDFECIEAAIGHLFAAVAGVGYLLQYVDHLLGCALLPDGADQL